MNPVSRRHFLKTAAFAAGAGALASVFHGEQAIEATLFSLAPERMKEAPDLTQTQIVASLPAGEGPGQVGIISRPQPLGPESFTIAPDGSIHILDTLNRRIISLNSGGSVRSQMPVDIVCPRDVLLTNGGV